MSYEISKFNNQDDEYGYALGPKFRQNQRRRNERREIEAALEDELETLDELDDY